MGKTIVDINRMRTVLYNAISMLMDDSLQYDEVDEFLERLQDELGVTLDELEEMGIKISPDGEIDMIEENRSVVLGSVYEWVENYCLQYDSFFPTFNSFVSSENEIEWKEVADKIYSDEALIDKVTAAYSDAVKHITTCGFDTSDKYLLANAFENNVSIKDVLGEILAEKCPDELCIDKWRVWVLRKGDSEAVYGTWKHPEPGVEFFDMSQDKEKFPNGQFTSGRYFIYSLLEDGLNESIEVLAEKGVGLALCGDVEAWTVPPVELGIIATWLKSIDKMEKEKTVSLVDTLAEATKRSEASLGGEEHVKEELSIE